ncbi:MAG: PTS fructose transporter subunit IIB [Anaerolineales bacterium]|nr:PTS fructose transporter subunit IIB [Anaerolineales bacterium]
MKIIAVTSCPIGLAHTYMAGAALKKAAKKKELELRVETQGTMGIRDRLTEKEIKEAQLLILATDITPLEPERFRNIPTFKVTTSRIIKNSDSVLQDAIESIQTEEE